MPNKIVSGHSMIPLSGHKPKAMLVVRGGYWQQESYETGSPDVRQRAKDLRKRGFKVVSSNMGSQVTPWGLVKTTMLSIEWPSGDGPDRPEVIPHA